MPEIFDCHADLRPAAGLLDRHDGIRYGYLLVAYAWQGRPRAGAEALGAAAVDGHVRASGRSGALRNAGIAG
jgi:hypothetical protein